MRGLYKWFEQLVGRIQGLGQEDSMISMRKFRDSSGKSECFPEGNRLDLDGSLRHLAASVKGRPD
jgi:hypothetical protein